ncbi:netrin receptor UNC5B-b-like [Patiria miniata]|uniref:ZU5 domain-containing protein n=1 Tax=Patiria miniata TaxID=46514 RepID=A0A914AM36_PATMI|nr:netrin receptor UNC5B-b-like [Patiria miniata]
MTAGFTEAELLQRTFKLPYIAIAYINERGGSLTLEKYKVHLYIPRDALAKGPPQMVYVFVDPSAPPVDGVNPPYVALSPMIQCGPTGREFLDSVVLSFPHHASNEWDLSTRMCHSNEGTPKIWQALDAETDGAMVLRRDNKMVLLLKHFNLFVADGIPCEASAKMMKTGAFGSLYDPSDARYAVRIHVWNNDPVAEKKVIAMENDLGSTPLDAYRDLQVFYNQGDVNATIDNIKTGWEMEEKTPKEQKILKTSVWQFPTNSVTFDLTRETNDGATASVSNQPDKSPPGCDSFVYQLKADSADSSWEGHKVRLSVRPKQGRSSPSAEIPERQEEESCQMCHQNPSSNAGICAACREELKGALTDNTGKETDGGLGGLSKETVKKFSRFLKYESGGRSNTMRLAEELFGQGTKLIATLRRGMANPAKQVLKLYFSFKREDHVPDQDAVVGLLEVFSSLDMEEAVRIVHAELNTQG